MERDIGSGRGFDATGDRHDAARSPCAGERLRGPASLRRKVAELALAGTAATGLGVVAARMIPINKNLWTPSYAVLMAGLAALALALCVALVDVAGGGARKIVAPFVWLGRNAIAAFTLSSLLSVALIAVRVPGPTETPLALDDDLSGVFTRRRPAPRLAFFALAYLAVWIAIFGLLYRRSSSRSEPHGFAPVEIRQGTFGAHVASTPHTGPVAVRFRTRSCPSWIVSTSSARPRRPA